MCFWVSAVAEPNRYAAQVLTTSPMKVSTLGLIRDSASQRTIVLSRTPQARPKALVQERHTGVFAAGLSEADDTAAEVPGTGVDGEAVDTMPSPLLAHRFRRLRRGWWRE